MKIKDRWAGFVLILLLALVNTVKTGNVYTNPANIIIGIIVLITFALTIMSYKNEKVGATLETTVWLLTFVEVATGCLGKFDVENMILLAIEALVIVYFTVRHVRERTRG